jgi:hypothetical protein
MPLEKIKLRPGVTVELTPTLNEGGFSASQLIRFFAGQLQKLGGWVRLVGVPQLMGICRGLFGWADQVGTARVAIGTEQRLYVLTAGVLSDITPIVATTNTAPMLTTTADSRIVAITDTAYSPAVGDWVNLVTQVAIGQVVVSGYVQVLTVSGTTYKVSFASILTGGRGGFLPGGVAVADGPGGAVPTYTTTNGSATVVVTMVDHRLVVGAAYYVTVSTVVAGLTLFGFYSVATVIDPVSFTITGPGLANANATVAENAGLMRLQYLLPTGLAINTALSGWGVGDWGAGDWGQSTMGVTSALIAHARTWSLDHFGQDLIASPDLGKIYHWPPPVVAPAVVLASAAPIINKVVLAIAQVQIIMACGSEVGGIYFPTLLRWCDQGDFTTWVATTTNQAGSFQLPTGSFVVASIAVGLGALVWTDVALWSVTYQGLRVCRRPAGYDTERAACGTSR